MESNNRNQFVALLLCLFLGVFGVHRFYLGYKFVGLCCLVTGGLFGILVIIDLLGIIFGTLKPSDGEYE